MLCALVFASVNCAHSVSPIYGESPRSSSRFQYTKLGNGGENLLEERMKYCNEINPLFCSLRALRIIIKLSQSCCYIVDRNSLIQVVLQPIFKTLCKNVQELMHNATLYGERFHAQSFQMHSL